MLEELAVELDRLLAGQRPADDLDVLPGAGQGAVGGLAVPSFDHLRTRDAEPEDDPSAREMVEGEDVHGGGGGGSGRQLDDRGAELDALGVAGQVGQRAERIGSPRLAGPDRVVAEPLGFLGGLDEIRRRQLAPVAPDQSQFHDGLLPLSIDGIRVEQSGSHPVVGPESLLRGRCYGAPP